MTNSQRLHLVRQTVTDWFASHSYPVPESIGESILVRDGFYCGRKFVVGDCRAVWFVEDEQVKLFDDENHLLASLDIHEVQQQPSIRRAA